MPNTFVSSHGCENYCILFLVLAVRILWTFDNNPLDFYGNFPGTPVNNPAYQTPGINGYGSCMYMNASANQSVTIPTPPFLNMADTSFSLSAWVIANSFRTVQVGYCRDNAIFGQFDQNTNDRSLHIIVRNRQIYFGFYNDDTQGNFTLDTNKWYHVRRRNSLSLVLDTNIPFIFSRWPMYMMNQL